MSLTQRYEGSFSYLIIASKGLAGQSNFETIIFCTCVSFVRYGANSPSFCWNWCGDGDGDGVETGGSGEGEGAKGVGGDCRAQLLNRCFETFHLLLLVSFVS